MELAQAAGVSYPTITRLERGTHQHPRTLHRVCCALGIPVGDTICAEPFDTERRPDV